MTIKYPKNLTEYFPDGRNKEFAMWAFGVEQPKGKSAELWDKFHPDYPMTDGETVFICFCKMNYLFHYLNK